ncbi:hypothetical protein RCL1_001426 [Eukaryota sp. TZLM3-RCL]
MPLKSSTSKSATCSRELPTLFNNFVFYIHNFQLLNSQLLKFQENIRLLGGKTLPSFNSSSITHVVTTDCNHFLESLQICSRQSSVHFVSPGFIADCLRSRTLKSEENYYPIGTKSEFFHLLSAKPLIQHRHLHNKPPNVEPEIKKARISTILDENLNPEITKELEKRADFAFLENDSTSDFRAMANKKAATIIKKFPIKLTIDNFEQHYDELLSNRAMGTKTLDKIFEILLTGSLQRNVVLDEPTRVIIELEKVPGIGPTLATEYYQQGVRCTNDLLEPRFYSKLPDRIKTGLKYLDDIVQPVPRGIVEKVADLIRESFKLLCLPCRIEAVGSYRRKARESGDVDLLVTTADDICKDSVQNAVNALISLLTKMGHIPPNGIFANAGSRVFGLIKIPQDSHYRRFDLFFTTESEYPFRLLGKTGSKNFCRSLRYLAMRRGYTLSDHGLVRREDEKFCVELDIITRDDCSRPFVLPATTEEDIFAFFNLPFIPPENRDTGVFEILQQMNVKNDL